MKTIKNKTKQILTASILTSSVIFASNCFAVKYIEDAQQYIEKGEYQSAIIQLKNQLKETPENAHARFLLGSIYLKTNDGKQAEKEITKAYQINPNNEDITLAYAQILLFKKDYTKIPEILGKKYSDAKKEQQRQIYNAFAFLGLKQLADAKAILSQLETQEANSQVYNGLARIALLEKEYDMAESWSNKALKINSEDIYALQTSAQIYISKKNYAEALAVYDSLIQKQSNNLKLYLQRAAIKIDLSDLDGAEKDILKVLQSKKNQPQANYMLARIRLQQRNYKEAQIVAQSVLNVLPRDMNSMLILGITNFALGNYNQADKYLTQYLSINPDNIDVQSILANVYLVQKKGEQALLILEGIDEEIRDQDVNTLMTMGSAYIVIGEYKKGVDLLYKARSLKPDNIEILKKLTVGQFKTGEIEQAIIGMEKIVNSDKANEKIAYLLILTYIQKNELKKADAKLAEFIQKKPDDPELYNIKGALEGIKGNGQKSRFAYEKAIALDKNFIAAYIGLAKEALSKNDFEQAKGYFKTIITIDKSYHRAYIALATIAEKEDKSIEVEEYLRASYNNSINKKQYISAGILLGKLYISKQQLKKLRILAKDLVRRYPEDLQVLSFLVGVHLHNNDSKAAQDVLQQIRYRYRYDTKHRLLLVSLFNKETGHEKEILTLLDEVIQIKPNSAESLKLKAAYLLKGKHYDQSLSIAKKIIQLFPNSSLGYQLEGNIYMVKNKIDKALSSYRKAYQTQPENKLLFLISEVLEKQGKQTEAINFLQKELSKNKKNIGIHFKLASMYQKNNTLDLAVKHHKEILKVEAENIPALNNLAWIYFLQGNEQSLVLSEKAFKNAPNFPKVLDTYGYILVKEGYLDKGIEILKKAVNKLPENNKIKLHLVEGYYLKGEKNKAKELLDLILKLDINNIDRKEALKMLKKVEA